MAGYAGGGKTTCYVVWTRGRFEIRGVAGIALRGHRLELAGRPSLVAEIAVHRSMRSSQRKAVIVLLHLPNGNLPSANGMALLAVCPQLTLVEVGMAILTALAHTREHGPDVTLGAGDRRVHAPKRIFRLIVIEFRNGADRSPRVGGVAVLAGYVQISVRTVGASRDLCPGYTGSPGEDHEKQCN